MKGVFVVAAFLSTAFASSYTVHHRIFHPSLPLQPYRQRGIVTTESSVPAFLPSSNLADDLNNFSEIIQSVETPSEVLYQVALQNEGDNTESLWDFSSVKVCHLSKASFETILIHLTGGHVSQSFALDYFVSPVAQDGSCPQSKSKLHSIVSPVSSLKSFAKRIDKLDTTVILRVAQTPSLPELKAPPPLTPEGEIVKPVQEKNFLQKYWMYIGGVLLVILVTGGGEEEPPKKK